LLKSSALSKTSPGCFRAVTTKEELSPLKFYLPGQEFYSILSQRGEKTLRVIIGFSNLNAKGLISLFSMGDIS
jgi:hypothetical protein